MAALHVKNELRLYAEVLESCIHLDALVHPAPVIVHTVYEHRRRLDVLRVGEGRLLLVCPGVAPWVASNLVGAEVEAYVGCAKEACPVANAVLTQGTFEAVRVADDLVSHEATIAE